MNLRAIPRRTVLAASICALLGTGVARAQGRGHGPPPGHGHGSTKISPGGQPAAQSGGVPAVDRDPGPTGTAGLPLRNFGAWVDDASVLEPGEAWAGAGLAYSRLPYARQLDLPVIDMSVGLLPRVQLAATLPVSNLHYPDGFAQRYMGDTYVSAKVALHNAGDGVGVAVAPLLEVLSDGSALDAAGRAIGRVHWALPVDLEYDGNGWRTYGSAGYFSRGAIFGSATLDVAVGSRAGVLGIVSLTRSTADPLVFDTGPGTSRSRADASAGAYARIGSAMSVYGLVGRTVSQQDPYSSSLSVSAGLSFRVAPVRTKTACLRPQRPSHRHRRNP